MMKFIPRFKIALISSFILLLIIYLFKVNSKDLKRCELSSKLGDGNETGAHFGFEFSLASWLNVRLRL